MKAGFIFHLSNMGMTNGKCLNLFVRTLPVASCLSFRVPNDHRHVIPSRYYHMTIWAVHHRLHFVCVVRGDDAVVAADDAADARFFSVSELADLPTSEGLIEALTEWNLVTT